jgi:hypothetical protein
LQRQARAGLAVQRPYWKEEKHWLGQAQPGLAPEPSGKEAANWQAKKQEGESASIK